jgi:hypothetical protein
VIENEEMSVAKVFLEFQKRLHVVSYVLDQKSLGNPVENSVENFLRKELNFLVVKQTQSLGNYLRINLLFSSHVFLFVYLSHDRSLRTVETHLHQEEIRWANHQLVFLHLRINDSSEDVSFELVIEVDQSQNHLIKQGDFELFWVKVVHVIFQLQKNCCFSLNIFLVREARVL